MTNDIAERAEQARNLRSQISGLDREAEQEFIIRDTSPRRRWATLYSMVNGQPIRIPGYMADAAISKTLPGGGYMFTAHKDQAPEFRLGTIRCFLADDSDERLSGVLAEVGIDSAQPCPQKELASLGSKRIHGEHRHKQEWSMYREYMDNARRDEERDWMRAQAEATAKLAGMAAPAVTPARRATVPKPEPFPVATVVESAAMLVPEPVYPELTCSICGTVAKSTFGLQAHMRSHKEAS